MVRPDNLDDAKIAEMLVAGDEQGITELLTAYGGRVSGYLNKRFPSLDEAEIHDVLVDSVIAVGQSFDPQRGTLAAWFLFLAHQAAVDQLRKGKRRISTTPQVECPEQVAFTDPPLDRLMRKERFEAVRDALDLLSETERAVVEADLEVDGTANAEGLAKQLGTTPDSVYAARRRARQKLVRRLGQVLGFPGR
jgi:RNA polymerase sigma factor (sigma-70 family)